MSKARLVSFLLLALSGLLVGCDSEGGGDDSPAPTPPAMGEPRPFYMGFTPWPYDSTLDALNTKWFLEYTFGE